MSLQKAAEQKFGVKPRITTGGLGELTLLVDGKSVFDHKQEGGLPETEELLRRIAAAPKRVADPARLS